MHTCLAGISTRFSPCLPLSQSSFSLVLAFPPSCLQALANASPSSKGALELTGLGLSSLAPSPLLLGCHHVDLSRNRFRTAEGMGSLLLEVGVPTSLAYISKSALALHCCSVLV